MLIIAFSEDAGEPYTARYHVTQGHAKGSDELFFCAPDANVERTCIDFMVRFSAVNVSGPRSATEAQLFVPDLIEHPRYRSQAGRMGHYLACNKGILKEFEERRM